MNGEEGYLTVNSADGFNGWHGGPTRAESEVPLMVNMPGPAVRAANGGNPAFVPGGFTEAVNDVLPEDGHLRNWHLSAILRQIVSKVRNPNDP